MATTLPMLENEINLSGKNFDRLVGGMYAEAISLGGVSVWARPELVGFSSKGVNVQGMMCWLMDGPQGRRLVVVYAAYSGILDSTVVGRAAISPWYKETVPDGDWLPVFGEAEENLKNMASEKTGRPRS